MDVMKFDSAFSTGIISKLFGRTIRKKLGYDIDISINNVVVTTNDGKVKVHLDLDADMSQEDFKKLIFKRG